MEITLFLAVDKRYHLCTELVTAEGETSDRHEEKLRASFAPDANRLDPRYASYEYALNFFFRCRKMSADAETLRKWALAAKPDRYRAVLEYLEAGELSKPLREKIISGDDFGWMENLPNLPVWVELENESLRVVLSGMLRRSDWLHMDDELLPYASNTINADDFLLKAGDWWKKNREEYLDRYRRKIFPSNLEMILSDDCADTENRKSWIVLFLLGISYTMGRSISGQHRSFIETCEEKGWLDVFADSPDENYDKNKWMDIIEKYFERPGGMEEQEHLQWMKNFPSIYAVSRFLSEYILLFDGVDDLNDSFR